MSKRDARTPALRDEQVGNLELRIGSGVGLTATLRMTPAGLLAVAGLVSAILLSTTVLVATSVREARN
jgi:hypothetical protein